MHRGGTIHSTLQEQNNRIEQLEAAIGSIKDLTDDVPSKNNIGVGNVNIGLWKFGSNGRLAELLGQIDRIATSVQTVTRT